MKYRLVSSILLLLCFAQLAIANQVTEAVVVGVGDNKQEALQNAFGNAVQLLRGTYVGVLERLGGIESKEVITVGLGNLRNYKVVSEVHDKGKVIVTVRVTMDKNESLKNHLMSDFKKEFSLEKSLDIAVFEQSRVRNSALLLSVMSKPETLLTVGYQFRTAGPPVIDKVGEKSMSGYLPVWIGRNSTFWLEFFDLLKAVEPTRADSTIGWYSGPYDNQLWTLSGQAALPFDIDGYRLSDQAGSVRIHNDLRDKYKPLVANISVPGSTVGIDLYFDRNFIVAGYDANDEACRWLLSDRSTPSPWFMAPGWTKLARNKQVMSAPVGSAIYIAPYHTPYSEDLLTTEFINYVHIYQDTQTTERTGENLFSYRSGFYHNWGLNKPLGTTGLGFKVKVPFVIDNINTLSTKISKLSVSLSRGDQFLIDI